MFPVTIEFIESGFITIQNELTRKEDLRRWNNWNSERCGRAEHWKEFELTTRSPLKLASDFFEGAPIGLAMGNHRSTILHIRADGKTVQMWECMGWQFGEWSPCASLTGLRQFQLMQKKRAVTNKMESRPTNQSLCLRTSLDWWANLTPEPISTPTWTSSSACRIELTVLPSANMCMSSDRLIMRTKQIRRPMTGIRRRKGSLFSTTANSGLAIQSR